MHQISDSIAAKIKLTIYGTLLVLGIIVARLVYLQINLSSYFSHRSKQNCLRTENTVPLRGNIIDRNGKLLATNRPVVKIYWVGTGNRSLEARQEQVLTQLETILEKPAFCEQILQKVARAERHYKELELATDITLEQLGQLEERFPAHPNISIKTDFQRLYPYASCAGHIMGYLSGTVHENMHSKMGKMGLEKEFEETLKGEPGTRLTTINSVGRKIAQQEIAAARMGADIQTTLDITLQELCERVFPPDYTGAIIVMDPAAGDILAMLSRPTFDPNMFLSPISTEQWQEIQEKKPFLNRALNVTYPPGSLFKLITVSAAIEHNIISPDSTIFCNGSVTLGNQQVFCHKRCGHGKLSSALALAKSCNVLCYEIGKKMDVDILAEYAHMFGLGEKTNIILPEKSGLVPNKEWKLTNKGERWWAGETLSVSIGQSFLLVTPIQVAAMISSIFTGFIPTPRLLTAEPILKRPLKIAPSTRDFLQKSMKMVVTIGTGQQVSKIKDYVIHAKTSTAQTSSFNKRLLGKKYLEHAWFAFHLQYKNHNPLTVVILAEHLGSSQSATAIAKNFLLEFKQLLDSRSSQATQ
jgi:penicillin-binding protein 2